MKNVLKIVVATLICAALLAIMGWSYISGAEADGDVRCRHINVCVNGSHGESFVAPDEVKDAVSKQFGNIIGKAERDIDLVAIEKFVNERSAVRSSEVYMTRDSVLNISIEQRYPVLRLYKNGVGCYCDCNGNLFPLQGRTTARVMIVDGALPVNPNTNGKPDSKKGRIWLNKMVSLADYVNHSAWKNRINQMSVDEHGDLVLYLRDTRERFIFGTPDDAKDKFERIETYLTSVKPGLEEGKSYSSVNVKFENQLVCR